MACAMLTGTADAAMYLIGEPAGEWSPAVGIPMEEADGGWKWSGIVGENEFFAFATELQSPDAIDWNAFNAGFRLSPADGDGTLAASGEYALNFGTPEGAFRGTGSEVTYFVKESGGGYTLVVTEKDEAPLYLIGAPAGEWSPAVGIKMKNVAGGWKWSGTVGEDDYFAFATMLQSPDAVDWNAFNAEFRISPDDGDGTPAEPGQYGMHLGSPSGAFRGTGANVDYFVKIVDGALTLTVTENSDVPEPEKQSWSVIGSFGNWEEDFPMTEIRPGVWKATMYDFSGDFKFRANNSWDVNYGAAGGDGAIDGDGKYDIAQDGSNFYIPEEVEEVIFELDVNNQILTVDGLTPSMLALRGDMNGWNFESNYLFTEIDDNVFMLYLDGLEKDCKFKVSDQDWYEEYTTGITDMTSGEMYELFPGAGLGDMGVDNNYIDVSMFFSLEDYMFWFIGEVASGVAAAEITSGSARYFNLQGSEVQNPSAGLYIRVINGKSEKVIVK